jgi:hypothetical protein
VLEWNGVLYVLEFKIHDLDLYALDQLAYTSYDLTHYNVMCMFIMGSLLMLVFIDVAMLIWLKFLCDHI